MVLLSLNLVLRCMFLAVTPAVAPAGVPAAFWRRAGGSQSSGAAMAGSADGNERRRGGAWLGDSAAVRIQHRITDYDTDSYDGALFVRACDFDTDQVGS